MRGTPQQIIEKYNQLARDAQLGNDRVAFENFQQHAEHYTRLLGEAQREMDTKREEQERQNRDRQLERDRERAQRQEREASGGDPAEMGQPDVIHPQQTGEASGLVETPEAQRPVKPRRPRKPRKPAAEAPQGDDATQPDTAPDNDTSQAAE